MTAEVDIVIECASCRRAFVWLPGEQRFYGKRGYAAPKRCKECREQRKDQPAAEWAGEEPKS